MNSFLLFNNLLSSYPAGVHVGQKSCELVFTGSFDSASRSCALLGNPIFIPKEKCPVITSSPRSMNNMFCCNILISQRLLEFCREASSFSKQPQASKCLLFTLCCQL